MECQHIPGAEHWEAWSPSEVASRLSNCAFDWSVAGGWALDLWHGEETRPHGDIEISVSSSALGRVRAYFPDHIFYSARAGALSALISDEPGAAHQFWVLEPGAGKWRLDVLTDPGDEHCWIYRRDTRIRAPRREMRAQSREGIPYLRPHAVLLFKAKAPRPKDEFDFLSSLPKLTSWERHWLKRALEIAHPSSPWLKRLAE